MAQDMHIVVQTHLQKYITRECNLKKKKVTYKDQQVNPTFIELQLIACIPCEALKLYHLTGFRV